MENQFIDGKDWDNLFNGFLSNVSYFKSNNSEIGRMITFLRTYSNLRDERQFKEFYAKTLVKLEELNIDGTYITGTQNLSDYVFNELTTLLAKDIEAVLPTLRSALECDLLLRYIRVNLSLINA